MTQAPTSPTAPSYGDELTDWMRAVVEAEAAGEPMPRHPYADRQHPGMRHGEAMMARQLSEPARAVLDVLDRLSELGNAAAVLYGQSLGDVVDRTIASARYTLTELDERLDQADRFAVAAQEDTGRLQRIAVDLCRERDRNRKGIDDAARLFDEVRTERAFLRLYAAELIDAGIDPADVDRARERAKAAAGIVERESTSTPEPGERTGPPQQIAPDLVDTLRRLGDQYGPLGVALAASTLTDRDAMLARLATEEPGR